MRGNMVGFSPSAVTGVPAAGFGKPDVPD